MEVKLPKPGDQLPFVVAKWDRPFGDTIETVHIAYAIDGHLFAYSTMPTQPGKTFPLFNTGREFQEKHGIPKQISFVSTVATTIEGGGE